MFRLDALLSAQRALRSRFDDFRQALERNDRTAMAIAMHDFDDHLRRWTEAEEEALIPALERAQIPGRDVRRELRLEYVQLRELSGYIERQVSEGMAYGHLIGYVENLDRRLRAHEKDKGQLYYPAADRTLTEEEWGALEKARPEE